MAVPDTSTREIPPLQDLGFGTVVGREHERRLLNRDGSFNVRRHGLSWVARLSVYHTLITMSWPRFLALVLAYYVGANVLFALLYLACGPGALVGHAAETMGGRFAQAFFFSVHTFATIGYGNVSPSGLPANLLVTVEALLGLVGFAIATGVLFARFSRPIARVLFSERAVIAPYNGFTAFMFRITNARTNELFGLQATVLFSRIDGPSNARLRRYSQLTLERSSVVFFPLSWTIVHPIDEKSPLWGLTYEELERQEAEFLIVLSATDETFAQTVHARSSYKPAEIVWGAKFVSLYKPIAPDGTVSIDVSRLSEVERVSLDAPPSNETGTWQHTGFFKGQA